MSDATHPTSSETTAVALSVVVLDCPEPAQLADFYCRLLGWTVTYAEEDWVTIGGPNGGTRLGFQRAPEYESPTWPTGPRPQMLHLDLAVPDLSAAHEHALAVGATDTGRPDTPTANFRVYTDPVGHPFCFVRE